MQSDCKHVSSENRLVSSRWDMAWQVAHAVLHNSPPKFTLTHSAIAEQQQQQQKQTACQESRTNGKSDNGNGNGNGNDDDDDDGDRSPSVSARGMSHGDRLSSATTGSE